MLAALIAAAAAIIGSGLTYLAVRRRTTGTVHHAEADVIFKAAEQLREEQRAEVLELRAEILSLRNEILSLRSEITSLRIEATALRTDADRLRTENAVFKTDAAVARRKAEETAAALAAIQRDISMVKIGDK